MKKIILLIYLFASLNIFSQEYQITSVPVAQYSIDIYTNEVYYKHEFTGEIFKTNTVGTFHILTSFTSVPQFANNSHTAAFVYMQQSNNDLYLHDFEKDTSYFIINSPYFGSNLLFSPSDNKILRAGDGEVQIVYYSFEDSSIHHTGITIYPEVMEWLTDTSIIYIELPNNIRVLNINDLSIKTLVTFADTVTIRGLANNQNINAFAYSWEYNNAENTLVNLYYLNTGVDSLVYNFLEDGPSLGGFSIIIRSLTWERNTNKLGFIGEVVINPFSFIYSFDYSSFQTFQYTDWNNADGIKYHLRWLNKDSIIYSDYTDGRLLFGLDVTRPVSVFENLPEVMNEFDIHVYPNPFNSSANISIYVPSIGPLIIEIFNSLGEIILTVNYGNVPSGNINLEWNEINNNRHLSTGIYFIRALFITDKYSTNKTVKVIYLK